MNSHLNGPGKKPGAIIAGNCNPDKVPEDCLIVIFGASGDLTSRKLVPSLYRLFSFGELPKRLAILGAARTDMNDDGFRRRMHEALKAAGDDLSRWEDFARLLHYQPVEYGDSESCHDLATRVDELAECFGLSGNRLFNLALPPGLYRLVAEKLAGAGLNRSENGWVRLVVEKPFGHDLMSARALHRAMMRGFHESQIFRIDHYLAKDTVQNLMMFRFANSIFEPLWQRNYIDYVSIIASESLGVEHRAGYYEKAGVLRDMFQNHMMQLLALVAGEPPSLFESERNRDEKAKLFRCLRPFELGRIQDYLVLGQYAEGEIDGRPVPAYRNDRGVDRGSLTPTFAVLKAYIDNWRWQGVPFYLTSGKRLKRKITSIEIQFKEVPHSLFREVLGEKIQNNLLTLGIHPHENITLSIQSKEPGHRVCLRSADLHFDFNAGGHERKAEAYEKVLLDAMRGDHTLFWRQDGLELCWQYFDPILHECESCRDRAGRLHSYTAGGWGPEAGLALLPLRYQEKARG